MPVSFWLTECSFIQLLVSDSLVRFQKVVADNANGGQAGSRRNILLVEFQFWKLFGSFVKIKPSRRLFTIVIKHLFISTGQYSIEKAILRISQMRHWTHFKMSNFLTFTDITLNIFIVFLKSFREIMRHCWNADKLSSNTALQIYISLYSIRFLSNCKKRIKKIIANKVSQSYVCIYKKKLL